MLQHSYKAMIEMMAHCDNIDFTPSLCQLFTGARHDYFSAQQAYPIFPLIIWADSHAFTLNGKADDVPSASR
jgi:hypothetical protein